MKVLCFEISERLQRTQASSAHSLGLMAGSMATKPRLWSQLYAFQMFIHNGLDAVDSRVGGVESRLGNIVEALAGGSTTANK